MHTAQALDLFAFSHKQIIDLVTPIPDQRWADQPHTIPNHPAWTLAHLTVGISFGLEVLGKPALVPEPDWSERFGGNSTPTPNRTDYPDRDTLINLFNQAHEQLAAEVNATPPDAFNAQNPIEWVREYFPTVGHAIAYFMMAHEPHHYGQLTVWRRAAGLIPA